MSNAFFKNKGPFKIDKLLKLAKIPNKDITLSLKNSEKILVFYVKSQLVLLHLAV